MLSTIFCEVSGTFSETLLTLMSLAYKIFSKNSWFLFLDKSQVQKVFMSLLASFTLSKNKNTEESIVRPPAPLSSAIFL